MTNLAKNAPRATSARADRVVRAGLAAAVLVFVVAAGALFMWRGEVERWVANEAAVTGGPFSLVDQDGQPFTRDDLIGHPHVMYFGFTFCPDLCPTTLFQLASVVGAIGEEAKPLKVVFVSVDPERDTAAVMKEYVAAFRDDFIGLTGPADAVAEAAKAYRVFYRKVPLEDGDYTIDHSTSAMLFHADGRYADSIPFDASNDDARAKIERLLAADRAQ